MARSGADCLGHTGAGEKERRHGEAEILVQERMYKASLGARSHGTTQATEKRLEVFYM